MCVCVCVCVPVCVPVSVCACMYLRECLCVWCTVVSGYQSCVVLRLEPLWSRHRHPLLVCVCLAFMYCCSTCSVCGPNLNECVVSGSNLVMYADRDTDIIVSFLFPFSQKAVFLTKEPSKATLQKECETGCACQC